MNNETIWVRCKWTREQLDDKTVEFRCRLKENGAIVTGTGKFKVRENPDGLLAINIVCDLPGQTPYEMVCQRFFIPQVGADAIEKHRAGVKNFECFAPI